MRIAPINCNQIKSNQNFGAKLDVTTEIMIQEAKANGVNTSKMEKLMKKVRPDETIYTDMYYDTYANCNSLLMVGFGKEVLSEDNAYLVPERNMIFKNPHYSIFGLYTGDTQKIDQKRIDLITRNLKNIDKKNYVPKNS